MMSTFMSWRLLASWTQLHARSRSLSFLLHLILAVSAFSQSAGANGEAVERNSFCPANHDSDWSPRTSNKLLIKGGIVVNADRQQEADVYVEDGLIVRVEPNLKASDDVEVIDATGKYVMPGGIDPHTHLEMTFMGQESCDDFFSGQAAALAGGTTMHIDFVIPSNGSLLAGYELWEKKAEKSCMDYGFHVAVTTWNEDVARDMEVLVSDKGINSFKFFLAYKGALMVTDEQFLQGLKKCKELGALAQVHAENGDAVAEGQAKIINLGIRGPEGHALSRPPVLEGEATGRAIRLAKFINTPLYVVHVMSKDALQEVANARLSGQRVIGEPIVSGLAFDESKMWDPDFSTAAQFVMSPPLREKGHDQALQDALAAGILQLVATDHAPFNSTQKAVGQDDFRLIPNGMNGIEERLHIVWDLMVNSGKITPSDFVRITSTACAQIFNVYPRKGALLPNSDADIIVFNPEATTKITASRHHSQIDTNAYEGWAMKGKVEVTISQGRIVWQHGKLRVTRGSGRYIPMDPFGYLFDGLDKLDGRNLNSFKAPVPRPSVLLGDIGGACSIARTV